MKRSKIITLTTDFGLCDHFVGVMRGVILSINPHALVVDLCHNVKPQDIKGAAFTILSSFKFFPSKTIHCIVVDPGVGSKRRIILVETENYFFLSPDNGALSYVLDIEKVKRIINVVNKKYFLKNISHTFHGRDIFAPVCAYLSCGVSIKEFGDEIKKIERFELPYLSLDKDRLKGEIIYIDNFGNLITNIPHQSVLNKNVRFKIKGNEIGLGSSYQDARKGDYIVIPGSSGFLEVSKSSGDASKGLRAKCGDKVLVEFIC